MISRPSIFLSRRFGFFFHSSKIVFRESVDVPGTTKTADLRSRRGNAFRRPPRDQSVARFDLEQLPTSRWNSIGDECSIISVRY